MKRVKWIITALVAGLLVISFAVISNINNTAKNILILDSLLNGTKMNYIVPDESDNISSGGESVFGAYNLIHQKALSLDMSKVDEMIQEEGIKIPEQYYNLSIYSSSGNMTVDYIYQIEAYKLICEVLSRPEINPDGSNFKIEPYHVYGSWFNETRLYNQSKGPFNIYNDLVNITNVYGYLGPFQLSKHYFEKSLSDVDVYSPRMYAYVSTGENNKLEKQDSDVIRIQTTELFGGSPKGTIIGTTYDKVDNEYIYNIKKNIVYQQQRPNPQFLPDAIYTFCRKLRTASLGKDIYTLGVNNSYKASIDLISNQQEDFQSDLMYLYSVQLNSSFVKGHQWSESGLPLSDGTGLMPTLFVKMIDKYGTLNVADLYDFQGWKQQEDLETFITGKEKGRGHLSNLPIVNQNNLVDDLGLRKEFDGYVATLNTELAQTLSYGLESIANGKMIQNGVEYTINTIYDWQEKKGYLLNEMSTDEESQKGLAEQIVSHFNGEDMVMSLPWSYKEKLYTLVYHNFYCNGNPFCSAHPRYTHYGVDYNHFDYERTKRIATNINVWADGVIVEVRTASEGSSNPWGNSIKVKHIIGNKEYYSRYGHLASMVFTKEDIGREVKCGEFIGIQGSTGFSTGLHLHFGLSFANKNGSETPVNPEIVLERLRKE